MLYLLDLDGLSKHTGLGINELKQKTYANLEAMIENMKKQIAITEIKDESYEEHKEFIMEYLTPAIFLLQWFSEKEIIRACLDTNVTKRELCQETYIEPGNRCYIKPCRFIRTSYETVPQYDNYGRELMERAYEKRDVYLTRNRYQGLSHGKIILKLLYTRYPELEKFKFNAYEFDNTGKYEIYTENHIYVPFSALMAKNVEAIKKRNRDYAKTYNSGIYTPQATEKRLEENEDLFETIKNLK